MLPLVVCRVYNLQYEGTDESIVEWGENEANA